MLICSLIAFVHFPLLKTPNLYVLSPKVITTFFIINPSAFTEYILSRGISKSTSSVFFERVTIHEANIISAAKVAGVESPFIHFVDPLRAEIIMEFIEGENAKDVITSQVCFEIGKYTALLHAKNIIHGDLTTSNFIVGRKLVLLDFGLSYYSTRIEDRAVDIRLIKQVFSSAHVSMYEKAYKSFINGYSSITSENKINKILKNISEIEQRGRYARVV